MEDKMSRTKSLSLAFVAAIIVLIIVQFSIFNTNKILLKTIQDHELQDEQIKQVYVIFGLVRDIETSSRGFLLTGNSKFLEPHDEALKRIHKELADLHALIPSEQFSKISALVNARFAYAESLIDKKKRNEPISLRELQEGKDIMDALRAEIKKFEVIDERLSKERNAILKRNSDWTFYFIIGGVSLSLIVVSVSGFSAMGELKKRRQAEHHLSLALATSEAISNNVRMGVIALDKKQSIIFANYKALSLTGFTASEMGNVSIETALKVLNIKPSELNLFLVPDVTVSQNFEMRTVDGLQTIKLTASPLYNKGNIEGKIIALFDITEEVTNLKELAVDREMAINASKAKSDFLAKMSHEIRTPLNAILGVGEIMNSTALSQEQKRCMEIFERSSQTLNNLVNDILDLSKIEAGKLELNENLFSLKNLVNSCKSIIDFRASQKGLLFMVDHQSNYDDFLGDEGRIRQVVLNLLGNAIKFTEKGSITLRVNCYPKENGKRELVFVVTDTGKGISKENLNKLFTNYQQESNRISSEYGGTGLGLSLSKELAQLMDGDIEVQSTIGMGSEFTFRCQVKVSMIPFKKTVVDEDAVIKPLKILLVDDNPENRFIINRYLQNHPVKLYEAHDGQMAYEMCTKENYDFVFMDINMPVMDGIESTAKIREWEKNNGHPRRIIIALSANAMSQEYHRAMEAGCDDYLTKPLPRTKLLSTLKVWQHKVPYRAPEPITVTTPPDDQDNEELDEEIIAMIPTYLENRRADIIKIEKAIQDEDFATLNRLGHNMAGTAKSYGQYELEKIARLFYQAAKDKNVEEMTRQKEAMKTLLG